MALPLQAAPPSEEDLLRRSGELFQRGQWHEVVTESMRYRYYYPQGNYGRRLTLLEGRAHMAMNDYASALRTVAPVINRDEYGEARYLLGLFRLHAGSAGFARRDFERYCTEHSSGIYREKAGRYRLYAMALTPDFPVALDEMKALKREDMKFTEWQALAEIRSSIESEIARGQRRRGISFAGSLLLPGFGHAYTGHWGTAILSFVSTVAPAAAGFWSWNRGDLFNSFFFGAMSLYFYQNNLRMSVLRVQEFNSHDRYYKEVREHLHSITGYEIRYGVSAGKAY